MGYPDRLHPKHSGIDDLPGVQLAEIDPFDAEFLELVADESEREWHSVDGDVQPLDQERHRPDVILVPVCQEQGPHFRGVVEQIRHVRNDDVDAHGGGVGKHHSAVDDDGFVAVLVHHQVHPDLAESAERDDAKFFHGRDLRSLRWRRSACSARAMYHGGKRGSNEGEPVSPRSTQPDRGN